MNDYQYIIKQIDAFVRKFYINQIIRGVLLSLIVIPSVIFLASFTEYFANFPVLVRTAMFYLLVSVSLVVLVRQVFLPLLHLFRMGNVLTHEQAAQIISGHFPQMKDKLLNVLQLAKMRETGAVSIELLEASIQQKTAAIKIFPFRHAVDFSRNLDFLKYLVPVFIVIFGVYTWSPSVLTEGSTRLLHHSEYFEPAAPFQFVLVTDTLEVEKGKDFELKLKITGDFLPESVALNYGGGRFFMKKEQEDLYSYQFAAVNNTVNFNFYADGFRSKSYTLKVLPTPSILNFRLNVEVPAYTGEKSFEQENDGELTIPAGSKVDWMFKTVDLDGLRLSFRHDTIDAVKNGGLYQVNKQFLIDDSYTLSVRNSYFEKKNLLSYRVKVIPDLYPEIWLQHQNDSTQPSMYRFRGSISDDYGFSALAFYYRVVPKGVLSKGKFQRVGLPFNPNLSPQEFFHQVDFSNYVEQPGDNLEYYFKVTDNDAVHGFKSKTTPVESYRQPGKEELEQKSKQASENVESMMGEATSLANEMRKDVENLRRKNLDNSASPWEKMQMMKSIAEKQAKIENLMKEIVRENQEKNKLENSLSEKEKEILEKQKQIEELLKNLITPELQKLLDEIQKLEQKFDQRMLDRLTPEMERNYEDLSKRLDKNMELLKRFEVEEKVRKTISKLEELSKQQQEMSEKVLDKKLDLENMDKLNQEQKRQFNAAMEEYKKNMDKNKELSNPLNLQKNEVKSDQINQNFENNSQSFEKQKRKDASQKLQQNASQMQQMAKEMQKMLDSNFAQQNGEDLQNIRQILDNLLHFSFGQEELIKRLATVQPFDPALADIITDQHRLVEDFEIIRDSVEALGKRNPMVSVTIDKEVASVDYNLDRSEYALSENIISYARSRQQYVMTSANNLALMFGEVYEKLQDQMQNQSSAGEGQSEKKGNSPQESLSQLRQQQEGMRQQLERMLQQLKDQEGQGKKSGKDLSKDLAKMLAQQEKFRKMLRDLQKNGNLSSKTEQKINQVKKMIEETEKDIAFKRVSPSTLLRQRQIINKMLEAEKSENQKETDNKRESKEAKDQQKRNTADKIPYKEEDAAYKESIRKKNVQLRNFYQNKYKNYIQKIK